MKKIFLSIILMLICIPVYASDNERFFANSERVEEMWVTKKSSTEYESFNPYFLKRKSDNTYVYCIEPFAPITDKVEYKLDNDYTKYGLTKEQIDRVNLITYYGYGYDNHTTAKWYGITQFLIWKEVAKDTDVYFTDKKDGKRVDLYNEEINEIESLIKENSIEPNFIKDYKISTNSNLIIDSNVDLSSYNIEFSGNYEIKDNKILISNLNIGEYTFKLVKKNNRFNVNYMLYYSKDSQNVILPGNSDFLNKEYSFKIIVEEGNVTLSKKSTYTKEYLKGAKYGVYENEKLVIEGVTDENGMLNFNLPYGSYKIKELQAPAGYKLDNNFYDITIDENHLSINLELTDDKIVIKVPNTGINKSKIGYSMIIIGSIGLIYGKKKYYLH